MTQCCLSSGQEKQSMLITRTLKFGKGDSSVVGQLGVITLTMYIFAFAQSVEGSDRMASRTAKDTR